MTTTESDTCFHAALDAGAATHPKGDFAKQSETPAARETDEDNHFSGVKVRSAEPPFPLLERTFLSEQNTELWN